MKQGFRPQDDEGHGGEDPFPGAGPEGEWPGPEGNSPQLGPLLPNISAELYPHGHRGQSLDEMAQDVPLIDDEAVGGGRDGVEENGQDGQQLEGRLEGTVGEDGEDEEEIAEGVEDRQEEDARQQAEGIVRATPPDGKLQQKTARTHWK